MMEKDKARWFTKTSSAARGLLTDYFAKKDFPWGKDGFTKPFDIALRVVRALKQIGIMIKLPKDK